MINDEVYEEDIVAKFAALSEDFYECLDIDYGNSSALSKEQCRRILQLAMGDLGHKNLDMEKLDQSYKFYLLKVDLSANPAYEIECPDFDKYF